MDAIELDWNINQYFKILKLALDNKNIIILVLTSNKIWTNKKIKKLQGCYFLLKSRRNFSF